MEPPDADPPVRWCGGRRLITSGSPIGSTPSSSVGRWKFCGEQDDKHDNVDKEEGNSAGYPECARSQRVLARPGAVKRTEPGKANIGENRGERSLAPSPHDGTQTNECVECRSTAFLPLGCLERRCHLGAERSAVSRARRPDLEPHEKRAGPRVAPWGSGWALFSRVKWVPENPHERHPREEKPSRA